MACNRLTIIKNIELALTIACLGLHYKTLAEVKPETILLAGGAFVGYLIILVGLSAGHLMGTPANKRVEIFFSFIGSAVFIAAGVLIIQEWEDAFIKNDTRKVALTKGGLAIVNGVLFLLDAFFSFRD